MTYNIAQKLRIRENDVLLALNAPPGFKQKIEGLPRGVKLVTSGKLFGQVHWFVRNRAQLEKEMSKVLSLLKEEVIAWVYFPKASSGMQTDLTRDKGWDCLVDESARLTWINLISFDHDWSVFGFRPKTDADLKKEKQSSPREIFNWVDPKTKVVRLPDDLSAALKKDQKAGTFFQGLSFTNKKEYIEWIITAKRTGTRQERISGTIERLKKAWKNPRNL
jgi:hypothetical protein